MHFYFRIYCYGFLSSNINSKNNYIYSYYRGSLVNAKQLHNEHKRLIIIRQGCISAARRHNSLGNMLLLQTEALQGFVRSLFAPGTPINRDPSRTDTGCDAKLWPPRGIITCFERILLNQVTGLYTWRV